MPARRFAPEYREAVKVALVLQALAMVVLLAVLDGGALARAGGAAMLAFWIGVVVVVIRRPKAPSAFDLLYVRWGYLVMLVIGIALSPFMGALRG